MRGTRLLRPLDLSAGLLALQRVKVTARVGFKSNRYLIDRLIICKTKLFIVKRNATPYNSEMIIGFRHKGLEAFYKRGTTRGIQATQAAKLRRILALLDVAKDPADLNIPSFKLHPLKGDLNGYWSIWVNGNWRVTFRFVGDDVEPVNYVDYH